MTNRPPAKLTPADLRKLKKVQTGPLLGAIPPIPARPSAKKPAAPAKAAPLGSYSAMRERLGLILVEDPRA
ncbi:MAG: hypothetical protein ACK46X_08120 [Candidatus Sericytochromatia bacterium]